MSNWNEEYDQEQWEIHNHLIDIGKCDNSCDDWLVCSESWKTDEEWAEIFKENWKEV